MTSIANQLSAIAQQWKATVTELDGKLLFLCPHIDGCSEIYKAWFKSDRQYRPRIQIYYQDMQFFPNELYQGH